MTAEYDKKIVFFVIIYYALIVAHDHLLFDIVMWSMICIDKRIYNNLFIIKKIHYWLRALTFHIRAWHICTNIYWIFDHYQDKYVGENLFKKKKMKIENIIR